MSIKFDFFDFTYENFYQHVTYQRVTKRHFLPTFLIIRRYIS